MENVPSIFGYTNYRQYLADYYEARKNSKHGYSHRMFCKKAGFTSSNVLQRAIDGSRNLTTQSIEQFITALELDGNKAEYFRNLVLMNQADHDEDKHRYFLKMQQAAPPTERIQSNADALELMQHWLYPVITELVQNKDFKDDPYWIKRRLKSDADLRQIATALNFLKKKGFIYKNEKGRFVAKDDLMMTSDEIRSLAIRSYYRSVIGQSIEMLETLPVEKREYGALIFYLDEDDVPELKAKLKTFLDDLLVWGLKRKKDKGAVMQFLLQMYPQTEVGHAVEDCEPDTEESEIGNDKAS